MKNIILNNYFSTKELKSLNKELFDDIANRQTINDKEMNEEDRLFAEKILHVHHDLGRAVALNVPVNSILDKVLLTVRAIHPEATYNGSRYIEYSPKWGNGKPLLTMHKDSNDPSGNTDDYEKMRESQNKDIICFDYKLSSNASWPVIVDDVEFDLQDNDALIMYPEKQIHGRTIKDFKENEFVNVLLISFEYNPNK